ncbi:transposable element Tcb2 transposase [Trichonephila clavipes]|nr:transposable element Tcb2 transposase [Trichonephila clavipes]
MRMQMSKAKRVRSASAAQGYNKRKNGAQLKIFIASVSEFFRETWLEKKSPGRLTRGRMIGNLEEGRSFTSVAEEFGINKNVVLTSLKNLPNPRYISKGGLFTPRPESCIPLNVGHRQHSLEWCKKHKNRTSHQWSRVLFTDKSRFSATSDSQRQLILREVGTWFHPSNITKRDRYDGLGVVFWVGVLLNGQTELHVFKRGFAIEDRYCASVSRCYLTRLRLYG